METTFKFKDFQEEKFNASEYVNTYIEKTLANTVDFSSLEKCNLSDLNKALENAMKSLKKIQDEINLEMEGIKLDRELNHSSVELAQDQLANDMNTMKGEFEALEKTILKFADKSIAVGTTLSQLDKEKEAAVLTSELIEFFIALNTTDTGRFPDIFKDNKNYETAAKYVYFLNQVANNTTTSEYSMSVKNVGEKYEQIKKILYTEFNDSVTKRDVSKLSRLLPLVVDFEILQDVITYYINSILRTISTDVVFELRNYDENLKTIENLFVNLMRVIKNELMSEENFFMNILEDKSIDVIKQFISHVFEAYIAKALDKISHSFGRNEDLYLKYYETIFLKTQEMIQDIHKMDFPQVSSLHETARAYFHNIFDEYQANYFTHEDIFLRSLFEKNIDRIQKQLEKQKEKETIAVGNVNHLEKFKLSRDEASTRIELLRDILMHEGTELMFSSLDESVKRCLNLCRFDEKNSNAIFFATKFLEYFGGVLLNNLVDFSSQIVPDLNRKTELNVNFFEIIFKLNSLVQRVEISIYKAVRELLKDRKYEILMEKKEKVLHDLEVKIERTLQKAISSLVIYSNRLLVAGQEKKEYYIKGSQAVLGPSSATMNFINFITPYISQIRMSYSENIKRRILSLLGIQLVGILVDHFGESKINSNGLLVIEKDMFEYEKLMDDFDDQNITNEFEVLKSLIHIYFIEKGEVDNHLRNDIKLKGVASSTIDRYKYNKP